MAEPPISAQPIGGLSAVDPLGPPAIGPITDRVMSVFEQRFDLDSILDRYEHDLRGEIFDVSKKAWVPKGKPRMNDDGVRAVMSTLRVYVNHDTLFGDLSDNEIKEMLLSLNGRLGRILYPNKTNFAIRGHWIDIKDEIIDKVQLTLSRAKDGGERDAIGRFVSVIENITGSKKSDNKFSMGRDVK